MTTPTMEPGPQRPFNGEALVGRRRGPVGRLHGVASVEVASAYIDMALISWK
jgi:hypothetical protein